MAKKPTDPPSEKKSPTERGLPPFVNRRNLGKIAVFTPDNGDSVIRLDKERIVIGTVISADIRLTGEGVAPIHAVIENGAESVTLYDLASESGVSVNGKKVVTQAIKPGDQIRIGSQSFKFTLEDFEAGSMKLKIWETEGRKLFLNPKEDFSPLLLEDEREVEEIFDYRPTSKPALEVVMAWHGTILDVEHFVKEKAVTIGQERRSDFGIPPLLATKEYKIVTRKGEGFVLNLGAQMKGVMQTKGELKSFDQIRQKEQHIPIGKEDFAKVTVGEIDFYLSYTAAPPKLKRQRLFERDPLFLKIFFTSMAMTVMVVTGLMNTRVPQNLDAEQIPDRIATILYQPEKYIPKPKIERTEFTEPVKKVVAPKPKPVEMKPKPQPTVKMDIKPNPENAHKPVPKEMNVSHAPKPTHTAKSAPVKATQASKGQSMAKEGEGARAKGKEGTRGSNVAKANAEKQNSANRPSPEGGKGRGHGASQVPDEGNVDFLKAAQGKIENILGNSAAHLGKGGEKLKGFGGFDTLGNGGLALSGDGRGGGGNAASLGGLGTKGHGGGRVGTGKGAAGSGSGIIGGQSRVAIRTGGPEEAVVMGAIDADAVEAALLAHRDEFRLCYEREINAEHPKLAGRVGTTFVIGSSGRVTHAGIESTTLRNASAERCILDVIRRIDFPIPRGAGVVQVSYPFKFSSVGH